MNRTCDTCYHSSVGFKVYYCNYHNEEKLAGDSCTCYLPSWKDKHLIREIVREEDNGEGNN